MYVLELFVKWNARSLTAEVRHFSTALPPSSISLASSLKTQMAPGLGALGLLSFVNQARPSPSLCGWLVWVPRMDVAHGWSDLAGLSFPRTPRRTPVPAPPAKGPATGNREAPSVHTPQRVTHWPPFTALPLLTVTTCCHQDCTCV